MRISIITPTRDRAHFLAPAIESVLAQNPDGVEHIVVDAMSTDGTAELLARHPHLRVIREPDAGLYDAMNKGLRAARGEFIGILNSDDLYAPGAFSRIAAAGRECDVVSGGAHVFKDEDTVIREVLSAKKIALNFRNVLFGIPLLNARFFRRSFVEKVGAFDLDYRIAADREWLLRALLAESRELVIPEVLYRYRAHEGSLTFDAANRSAAGYHEEHALFAERHLASPALTGRARKHLRACHTHETAWLAAMHWSHARPAAAREWARRGCARNRLWPLFFARRLAWQALGR